MSYSACSNGKSASSVKGANACDLHASLAAKNRVNSSGCLESSLFMQITGLACCLLELQSSVLGRRAEV